MYCSFMLINTLTIVNKLYLIVKCYQFIIPIEVFGTQNEMTDSDTHHLTEHELHETTYMKK